MIETLAAHKLAAILIVAALGTLILVHRKRSVQLDALAGTPASIYDNSQAAQSPDSFTLPGPQPFSSAGAQPTVPGSPSSPGPNVAVASTSTGPGAGPTLAGPLYTNAGQGDYIQPVYSPDVPNALSGYAGPAFGGQVGTSGTLESTPGGGPSSTTVYSPNVDPSGHVVSPLGTRVGGATLEG